VIHHGDCLEVMAAMEAGSVDAVVTDPPYGIDHASERADSKWRGQTISCDSDTAARDLVIAWANEHGKPWACFGTWKTPPPDGTRTALVWDKGPASGMGDLSLPWKLSWELIYIGGRGWRGHRGEGVIRGCSVVTWSSKGRVHPMQKPVNLLSYLLRKLPDAHTILDPFMGSGTTGVACAVEGRDFIGIEREAEYVEIARRRIEAASAQLRLAIP